MLIIRPYSLPRKGDSSFYDFTKIFANQEQTRDLPVYIHVNVHGGGGAWAGRGIVMMLPQTTTTKPAPALKRTSRYIQRGALGRTRQLGVVAEGILRFGNAPAACHNPARSARPASFFGGGGVAYAARAVDFVATASILSVSGASSS